RLYWPTLNSAGQRVGIDKATGQLVPATQIGLIVPNSGNLTNGVFLAGHGISEYLVQSPGLKVAPRVGVAWDITGKQNLVFRTGAGLYYDRIISNDIGNMTINPPSLYQSVIYNDLAT